MTHTIEELLQARGWRLVKRSRRLPDLIQVFEESITTAVSKHGRSQCLARVVGCYAQLYRDGYNGFKLKRFLREKDLLVALDHLESHPFALRGRRSPRTRVEGWNQWTKLEDPPTRIFLSITEAATDLGVNKRTIKRAVLSQQPVSNTGRRKSRAAGWRFRFTNKRHFAALRFRRLNPLVEPLNEPHTQEDPQEHLLKKIKSSQLVPRDPDAGGSISQHSPKDEGESIPAGASDPTGGSSTGTRVDQQLKVLLKVLLIEKEGGNDPRLLARALVKRYGRGTVNFVLEKLGVPPLP